MIFSYCCYSSNNNNKKKIKLLFSILFVMTSCISAFSLHHDHNQQQLSIRRQHSTTFRISSNSNSITTTSTSTSTTLEQKGGGGGVNDNLQERQQRQQLPVTLNSSLLLSSILLSVLIVAVGVGGSVQPVGAIDLPGTDNFHLNIPNPIPDADPRYFVSGGLCAAASHGITTPIDVVKTKIQADPKSYRGVGFVNSAYRILQKEGKQVLFLGLGPTVIGYGIEGAAKFGLYESLKPTFAKLLLSSHAVLDSAAANSSSSSSTLSTSSSPDAAIPYLIASVVAGAVASLMLCPMEKARVRLVTDPNFSPDLIRAIPRLIDESGGNIASGLFGGLPAMLSKQLPYTFAKQVSFDSFAAMLYSAAATNTNLSPADIKLEVSFGAALLASVLACLLSHPGDVILTATYKDAGGDGNDNGDDDISSNPSVSNVISQIYQTRGIQGFFSGLSARFLHVGAIITSQLVLYDTVKQLLGLPATGA